TARGSDEGGDLVAGDVHRDLLQALELAVVEIEVAHLHDRVGHQGRARVAGLEQGGSHVGSCGPVHPLRGASRNSVRATMLIASTISAMSAAPPHARRCQSS